MSPDSKRNKDIDGGWGWVVLVGAFLAFFIADGWSYSFGIIFPEIVDYFSESKGKTAIIPTLLYGIPMLISPVVCSLINVFGCRRIGMTGGVLTGFSFLIASFASSVGFLCLTIGILCSIGLSMVYVSSLIIVTCYFEKRRGFATSLAVTGSGLGAFAFPPLLQLLMEVYSWRGMMLITSGIGFNLVCACAVYRELEIVNATSTERIPELGERTDCDPNDCDKKVSDTSYDAKRTLGQENARTEELDRELDTHKELSMIQLKSLTSCNSNSYHSISETKCSSDVDIVKSNAPVVSYQCVGDSATNKSMKSVTKSSDTTKSSSFKKFWNDLALLPSSIFDKKVLRNSFYIVFCSGNFLLFLWISMPFVYIVDAALELNISEDRAVFLLSIIAIARTVGQIVFGLVGDVPNVSVNVLYGIGAVASGIGTLLVPLCGAYLGLCIYSAVFGLMVSVTSVLPMMCIVEIVGLERSTNAFGLLQLVQGIGTLLGTPISGWMNDATGDYNTSFYIAGAWILLSGVALLPMPLIRVVKPRVTQTTAVS